ncbi:Peroxidase 4 [Linum grandiflorum]
MAAGNSNISWLVVLVIAVFGAGKCWGQLCTDFYSESCPMLMETVRCGVESAVAKETRIAASLLRLHFHDCFVNGCDGSILLEDTDSFTGEQTAAPNNGSVRGYNVIEDIKSEVEKVCPGVVSCADIVAIAARDSTVIAGGQSWEVKVGRRDSKTASFAAANGGALPPPTASLQDLIDTFDAQGLSVNDMVVLSGSHTIGLARCVSFRTRIYNETNIDPSFATERQGNCPLAPNSGDDNLAPLDLKTPKSFDNNYYNNLIQQKGLLHSDQVLFNGGSTDSLVRSYSENPKAFAADFAAAMVKMGDIKPLTGSEGEIRNICSRPN